MFVFSEMDLFDRCKKKKGVFRIYRRRVCDLFSYPLDLVIDQRIAHFDVCFTISRVENFVFLEARG